MSVFYSVDIKTTDYIVASLKDIFKNVLKAPWGASLHICPTAALRRSLQTQVAQTVKPWGEWCLMMFNTNTKASWEWRFLEPKQTALWRSVVSSQCHSSWRLFHLLLWSGRITYYITVHLVSKDTLTTPLNKEEKSCGVLLLGPEPAWVFACDTRYTAWLPRVFTDVITLFYHPFT